MDADLNSRILPAHIDETIRSIAKLHADQARDATVVQQGISRLTQFLGRPAFLGGITLVMIVWVALNVVAAAQHRTAVDPPPFIWLQGIVSVIALYMTILILATQQRDDILAGHREQLTLELAILGEQKMAKLIALVEDLRRDNPLMVDRVDSEAEAMSVPADPQKVFDAIKETEIT